MKKTAINTQEQGAAAVEFALIMPLLVVLVFGIIEFSLLFYNKAMITNASREGARAGIVYDYPNRPEDSVITGVVNNYCSNYLVTFSDSNQLPVTTVTRSGNGTGASLNVTVTYDYDFLVLPNFLRAFFSNTEFGDSIQLSATTVMRLE